MTRDFMLMVIAGGAGVAVVCAAQPTATSPAPSPVIAAAAKPGSAELERASQLITSRAAKYGFEVRRIAAGLIGQGRDDDAAIVLDLLERAPEHPIDAPDCKRMRAVIARNQGDDAAAERWFRAAVHALDDPKIEKSPTVRAFTATALLDLARQLARNNAKRDEIARIYDRVETLADAAPIRDIAEAARARADLLALSARHAEAADKIAQLLQRPASTSLPAEHRLNLRMARAGYLLDGGDATAAAGEFGAIFRDPEFSNQVESVAAGARYAALLPVHQRANDRICAATDVIDRIRRFEANPPRGAESMSPDQLADYLAAEALAARTVIQDTRTLVPGSADSALDPAPK